MAMLRPQDVIRQGLMLLLLSAQRHGGACDAPRLTGFFRFFRKALLAWEFGR